MVIDHGFFVVYFHYIKQERLLSFLLIRVLGNYMNFLELVKNRQSVRAYSDKSIEHKYLLQCVEAARLAPSACNSQPWHFIIVDDPKIKEDVAKATFNEAVSFNKFALNAPAIIVVTASRGNLRTKVGQMVSGLPYFLIDVGIATQHFCLQATELGLGTCMIGWFNEKKLKSILNIPKSERVSLLITVGYPKSDETRHKSRKELGEIWSSNTYR